MQKNLLRTGATLAALLLTASGLHAHTGIGSTSGFAHGVAHPLGGLDHLLAMIAVGLWAAQLGGRAIWAVPASFVGVMALGGALGMLGINVPFVEGGIGVSVLTLGVLIAAAARLPLAASVAIVGIFAIFHGHAHGAEMPAAISGWLYAAGFVIATAFLHLCGIGTGIALEKLSAPAVTRFAGAAIFVAGTALLFI